jgi:hypothetical protein
MNTLDPSTPSTASPAPIDPESAAAAFRAVRAEIDAVDPTALAAMNVDVPAATATALGAAPALAAHRDTIARLPDFDLKYLDALETYAKAAWFAYVNALPQAEDTALPALVAEVVALRAKLLMWATPLVGAGIFPAAAVDRIREGSGSKDAAGDDVALVELYRAHWDKVRNLCGVTEVDLARGEHLGTAAFRALAQRESPLASAATNEAALLARKAWTLLDRAYTQNRRALAYVRHAHGDADEIAPSLRRNNGPRATQPASPEAPVAPAPPSPPEPAPPAKPIAAPVGDGSDPYGRS